MPPIRMFTYVCFVTIRLSFDLGVQVMRKHWISKHGICTPKSHLLVAYAPNTPMLA